MHNLSTCAQPIQISPEGTAGNEGPGEGTYTTSHPCGGCRRGRRAWPGFEPTRRAKLAARTAGGPDGARNTGAQPARTPATQPARTPAAQPTETPAAQQQEHQRRGQQEPRRRSSNAGMREARRRVATSGPLRKDHLSLMRSSQVRRSPTRMPKSRFWSAMAASVAGFLMRAASTSGAAVMAPTP